MDRPELREIEGIIFEEQCHLSCSILEEDNEQVIHEIAVKILALIPNNPVNYRCRICGGEMSVCLTQGDIIEEAKKQGQLEIIQDLSAIDRDAEDTRDFTRRVCELIVSYEQALKEDK